MKKRTWIKLVIGISIVFMTGFCTGVIGTVLVGPGIVKKLEDKAEDPKMGHEMVMKLLTRKLKLDESQEAEVSVVMTDIIAEIVPIRDQTREKLAETIDSHSPRIREVLREEQIPAYEQFLHKLGREWRVVLTTE